MGASSYVHITVEEILRETENALLILLDGDELWVPRSQVAGGDDYTQGDRDVTLSVTEWWANKNGVQGDE